LKTAKSRRFQPSSKNRRAVALFRSTLMATPYI
jgi:hypothetical protein